MRVHAGVVTNDVFMFSRRSSDSVSTFLFLFSILRMLLAVIFYGVVCKVKYFLEVAVCQSQKLKSEKRFLWGISAPRLINTGSFQPD